MRGSMLYPRFLDLEGPTREFRLATAQTSRFPCRCPGGEEWAFRMTNNGFVSKPCRTAIVSSLECSITNIFTALPAICAMSTQVAVRINLHTMHRPG